MVVMLLAKAEKGVKWSHLKKSDQAADNKPKLVSTYQRIFVICNFLPFSLCRFTPKADDPSADPSANLMTMMKQMYEDGDDDMKRTIAKAWTESRDKQSGEMDNLGQLGGL